MSTRDGRELWLSDLSNYYAVIIAPWRHPPLFVRRVVAKEAQQTPLTVNVLCRRGGLVLGTALLTLVPEIPG